MTLQEKPSAIQPHKSEKKLGLYLHVPFCASTCDFCAFYQNTPEKSAIRQFIEGVELEVARFDWQQRADTVFWGGGTPGLLPVAALETLGALLAPCIYPNAEWSVELAPALVNPPKLRALRALGVNRISLGVQSFDEELLKKLGREHSPEQARRAYAMIRDAGFESVNLDLMFALPGQSLDDWLKDLQAAWELAPDHLSTYCLTFEEDTALWVKLQEGRFKRDIEQEARLYTETWQWLESHGMAQYEISNFARPGHACEHNLNTWRMHEWIGLGPSAASQYQGRRTTHVASTAQWHAGLVANAPIYEDLTPLTPLLLGTDALIFGLRMNAGVNLTAIRERFGVDFSTPEFLHALSPAFADGLLCLEADQLKLTEAGRLLADSVATHILGITAAWG